MRNHKDLRQELVDSPELQRRLEEEILHTGVDGCHKERLAGKLDQWRIETTLYASHYSKLDKLTHIILSIHIASPDSSLFGKT